MQTGKSVFGIEDEYPEVADIAAMEERLAWWDNFTHEEIPPRGIARIGGLVDFYTN